MSSSGLQLSFHKHHYLHRWKCQVLLSYCHRCFLVYQIVCLQVDDWNNLHKLPLQAYMVVVMAGVGEVVYYLVAVVVDKILRYVDASVEGFYSQVEMFHLYVQVSQ